MWSEYKWYIPLLQQKRQSILDETPEHIDFLRKSMCLLRDGFHSEKEKIRVERELMNIGEYRNGSDGKKVWSSRIVFRVNERMLTQSKKLSPLVSGTYPQIRVYRYRKKNQLDYIERPKTNIYSFRKIINDRKNSVPEEETDLMAFFISEINLLNLKVLKLKEDYLQMAKSQKLYDEIVVTSKSKLYNLNY